MKDITQLSKARRFQLRRIAEGLCPNCGDDLPKGCKTRCPECTRKAREKDRIRHNRKPWVKGQRGRPPKYPDAIPDVIQEQPCTPSDQSQSAISEPEAKENY